MCHILRHALLLIKYCLQTLLNSNQQLLASSAKHNHENVPKSITVNQNSKKVKSLKEEKKSLKTSPNHQIISLSSIN